MKKLTLIASLIISGCAVYPEEQSRMFDDKKINIKGERILMPDSGNLVWRSPNELSVKILKNSYKEITGNDMVVTNALVCRFDEDCYKNEYLNYYVKEIEAIHSERRKIYENKQEEDRVNCEADAECSKQKYISNATSIINMQYRMLIATNPYNQAEADAVFRQVCRGAGKAQRSGVSKDQLIERINLLEGIPPQVRQSVIITADSCWILSKYGVSDGTVKISNNW